jgi:hypothetical protein
VSEGTSVWGRVPFSMSGLAAAVVRDPTFLRVGHCLRAHDLVKRFSGQESQFHASFAQAGVIFISVWAIWAALS